MSSKINDTVGSSAIIVDYDVITPYGIGLDLCWDSLLNSKTAIGEIDRINTENFITGNAALIEGLDPSLEDSLVVQMLKKLLLSRMPIIPQDTHLFLSTTTGEIDLLEKDVLNGKESSDRSNSKNLLDKIENTISYTSTIEDNTTIHKWEVKDVPRMFPERNMPPISSVVQRLLVSTVADWQTISRWYWNLCLPHINATTPEMKEKVTELIKGKKTDIEKVKTIY